MKRRELFSSLSSSLKKNEKTENCIYPPYFNNQNDFKSHCIKCEGICESVCETQIIKIKENKIPYLDFSNSGCTYCDECAKVCPYDVLSIENKQHINVSITIDILKCLSWNQTMCFSCKDPCLDDAIEFIGLFRPEINQNCTSCGFCLNSCPTNAIQIG